MERKPQKYGSSTVERLTPGATKDPDSVTRNLPEVSHGRGREGWSLEQRAGVWGNPKDAGAWCNDRKRVGKGGGEKQGGVGARVDPDPFVRHSP